MQLFGYQLVWWSLQIDANENLKNIVFPTAFSILVNVSMAAITKFPVLAKEETRDAR